MELFFRTRDVGTANDYPAIGWMPPLPSGSDRLWKRFKDYANAEQPQLALAQRNGRWELYLEGLNSGRTDSATGQGGRTIRMSLYLSGTTAEAAEVTDLLPAFVFETIDASFGGKALQEKFARLIRPGDPRKWKDGGIAAQREAAAMLLGEFRGRAFPELPLVEEVGWAGGRNRENLKKFVGSCRALLEGRVSGYALTFPYCRMADVSELAALLDGEPLVAVLSGDAGEASVPSRRIGAGPRPKAVAPEPPDERGQGSKKSFFVIALVLVLTGLLIKCCSTATKGSAHQATNSVNQASNHVQGK